MSNSLLRRIKKLPNLRADNLLLYVLQKAMARKLEARGILDSAGRLAISRIKKPRFLIQKSSYKQLVSVGGIGWSGSSAVVDLLAEYKGVTSRFCCIDEMTGNATDPYCFEFELCRNAGGLFNLEHAFLTRNFFERDASVRIFCELANMLYISNRSCFGDEFVDITRSFLDKIIQCKVTSVSGYDYCHHLSSLGNVAVRRFVGTPDESGMDYVIYLKDLTVEEYRACAREYLSEVLRTIKCEDVLVLDQAVSDACFDVQKYQDYFGSIKCIFVWRDPCDQYVASQNGKKTDGFIPDSPYEFVEWYKYNVERALTTTHSDWLNVSFESLLFNYDCEVAKIEKFIGIDPGTHIQPNTRLIPKESIARSVGIWKNYHDQRAINVVRDRLRDFVYKG